MCSRVWALKLIQIDYKVVAMTTDDASDVNVAAKKPQILKCGTFTHIFKPEAQKI